MEQDSNLDPSLPRKRQRTETGEDGDASNEWTRHRELYMPDGNIVILAGDMLFRVYSGLLSKHSEVFSGMASLSAHQPPDAESYEGAPLVRLTDNPGDLAHFLNTFNDIDYFPGNGRATPFPVVTGILRLATKYMVPSLRARAISHIVRFMPMTLEDIFEKWNGKTATEVFGPRKSGLWPRYFEWLILFRECNVEKLLPWGFYTACKQSFQSLLSGRTVVGQPSCLSPEDVRHALRGFRDLRKVDYRISYRIFEAGVESCSRAACNYGTRAILLKNVIQAREDSDALPFSPRTQLGNCDPCAAHFQKVEEEEMRKVWEALPSYFGLRPWEDLLRAE